jgi:DeoR/GlpR family transcriptional regulator of sugar metabolism
VPQGTKRTLSATRQQDLLNYLRTYQTGQVSELSELMGASASTIRRDLDELQRRGLVERVHGGASITDGQAEPAVGVRASVHSREKLRIGRRAAELVEDGSTILISGGTTTAGMLMHLGQVSGLTVVTNSLSVAGTIARVSEAELIVLGGVLRRSEMSLLGHITTDALVGFHIDTVFTGAFGLDPNTGLSGANLGETDTDRSLVAAGDRLVVLADGSKFAQRGPIRLAPVESIDTLVTDGAADDQAVRRLREQGVEVIVC